jgi:hypothetical protein
VIGHLKDDHRMRRDHLADASGDAISAVPATASATSSATELFVAPNPARLPPSSGFQPNAKPGLTAVFPRATWLSADALFGSATNDRNGLCS